MVFLILQHCAQQMSCVSSICDITRDGVAQHQPFLSSGERIQSQIKFLRLTKHMQIQMLEDLVLK